MREPLCKTIDRMYHRPGATPQQPYVLRTYPTRTEKDIAFGKRLTAFREARLWCQKELAEKLHVAQGTLGAWENGTTPCAPIHQMHMATAFGISLRQLQGREDEVTLHDETQSAA